MSDLPKSWALAQITEVLEPNEHGKPFQQGWSPQCDGIPAAETEWGVLKTTAIQPGEFRDFENKRLPDQLEPRPQIEVKLGDVLMTCAGPRARCGVACLVERTRPQLMMSGKMYRFRPHPGVMHPKYLAYLLQTRDAQNAIDRMKTGISDSGLNLTHDRFATLKVPLAPQPEQVRIVAKIEELFSELDKAVESLTTAREQLKAYRQSVLKHAFEGKLTVVWRAQNPDPMETPEAILSRIGAEREARYTTALAQWQRDVGELHAGRTLLRKPLKPRRDVVAEPSADEFANMKTLPTGWAWVLLSQLAEHIVDGTHKTPSYRDSGVPFVSAKDITEFRVNFADTRFISQSEHEELSRRCFVKKGNVLLTKSGTIGRVAVVATDAEFSLFESVANIPLFSQVDARFVSLACYFLIDTYFGAKNQKGVAVRHLHLEDIRRLPVPLPCLAEQREIVWRLDALFSQADYQEQTIDGAFDKVQTLRRAVLKKAFSGQLVPEDPADEPAFVLLARIRDEWEHIGSGGRKNKKKDKEEAA